MHVVLVAGARPNFMKIAPILAEMRKAREEGADIQYTLVHTGQHYDKNLSDHFFEDLGIPDPDFNLNVGSGSHARQTAAIMCAFEDVLAGLTADLVMVVGDVNSTLACSITAKKLGIKVAHVEAGLRSRDLSMPEEINRMVTDSISDYFFTTSDQANRNLLNAGVVKERIFFVGNTMIDTLVRELPRIKPPDLLKHVDISRYVLVTIHRPSNVDDTDLLFNTLDSLSQLLSDKDIVFPVHPRTWKSLTGYSIPKNLHLCDPLRYHEFLYLVKNAWLVITDSGGIQEETTYLRVPCITLRENTERPETVTIGSNHLVGNNMILLKELIDELRSGNWKVGVIPPKWEGRAAERIVSSLMGIDNF